MKKILFLILTMFSMSLLAQVDVEVTPQEPVINESFFVTFKVKGAAGEEPYISFTPYGASVLGKTAQGTSISTVVINGKFQTNKEQTITYELLAERSGQVYLRNVKVEISGKSIPVNEVRVTVLNEPRRIPDAFIEAEVSKTKVYLGEGIDVNYYLYSKVPVTADDVKQFPKLNKFIKRFHHTNSPGETIRYKGQVLRKNLVYSARIYPEKVGRAVIDAFTLTVQIPEQDYNGFGFGAQRFKRKDLSSANIDVEVLPLPTEGLHPGFTGLIGEHEFNLTIPKTKYLVNEPIELSLEVKGKGAVENYDAPVIYADNNLEQFDTKSEVTEIGNQAAKKVFEYTLLPRGPVNIAARTLSLAYFDPSSGKYIEKKVSIPALEVSGVAAPAASGGEKKPEAAGAAAGSDENNFLNSLFKNKKDKAITKNQIGLSGPNLVEHERWLDRSLLVLNSILGLILLLIGAQWAFSMRNYKGPSDQLQLIKRDIKTLKKKGLNYPELYRVLSALDKTNKMAHGGVSITNVIEDSELAAESKTYFKNALLSTEGGSYGKTKASGKLTFEKKHFNELMKNV